MNIKKLNQLLEKALKNPEKFIQFGSFHDDPETIYVNENESLRDSFNNRDFDNRESVEVKNGNLLFLSADDESIDVHETIYKTKEDFIKAVKDGYSFAKEIYDENEVVEVGAGYDNEPDALSYFFGYIIEDDKYMESPDAFCKVLVDWFNDTYIDKDSGEVFCLIDPKTFDIVLGGSVDFYDYNPEDWEDEGEE